MTISNVWTNMTALTVTNAAEVMEIVNLVITNSRKIARNVFLNQVVKIMSRILEIEISCCGDCPYYDWKKHRCTKGATDEGKTQEHFYKDCPLNWREVATKPNEITTDLSNHAARG